MVLSIIESSIETCLGIEAHLDIIAGLDVHLARECTRMQLGQFQMRMQSYKRSLNRLLELSAGTSNLVRNYLCNRSRVARGLTMDQTSY